MNPRETQHLFFSGVTHTGKSTLMRKISRESGRNMIIYDPTYAPVNWTDGWRPGANRFDTFFGSDAMRTDIFHDKHTFLAAVRRAHDCDVFIDEAGDIFAHTDRDNFALATKGRHAGLRLRIAAQRPTMVSPNVRSQCPGMFLFRMNTTDLKAALADAGFDYDQLPCAAPTTVGQLVTVDGIGGKIHSGYYNVQTRHR